MALDGSLQPLIMGEHCPHFPDGIMVGAVNIPWEKLTATFPQVSLRRESDTLILHIDINPLCVLMYSALHEAYYFMERKILLPGSALIHKVQDVCRIRRELGNRSRS